MHLRWHQCWRRSRRSVLSSVSALYCKEVNVVCHTSQHAHYANENLFHALNRTPSFRGRLVHVGVVARRMQNGNADSSVLVDVWVEDCRRKLHLWRAQRVVRGERQRSSKEPSIERSVLRALNQTFPFKKVTDSTLAYCSSKRHDAFRRGR